MKILTKRLSLIAARILITGSLITGNTAIAGAADTMLNEYIQQGAKPSSEAGKSFWNKSFKHAKSGGKSRSCATCHTANLSQSGKHTRTGKVIKPMAPSANIASLTKRKKINKWFKRNCKWTLGRECSKQEKADVLAYLKDL